jgi:hypothetical protein
MPFKLLRKKEVDLEANRLPSKLDIIKAKKFERILDPEKVCACVDCQGKL